MMRNICVAVIIFTMIPIFVQAEKRDLFLKHKHYTHYAFSVRDSLTPIDSVGKKDSLQSKSSEKDSLQKDSVKTSKKEKKKTPYDLLFDKKKKETAKGGFITIHKVGEKIYFEFPVKYLKKQILLGSSIASVSDPQFFSVGRSYVNPTTFYFDIQDSTVVMKQPNELIYSSEKNKNLDQAIKTNFKDPTLLSFKIEAYSNDSTAVVFNMASVVAKNNSLFPVIPNQVGNYKISTIAENQLSAVQKIKSFESNISIRTELSYKLSATIMGIIPVVKDFPFTMEVIHSFILLPEKKMTPRFADARVGISATGKFMLTSTQKGVHPVYFTKRWNLNPKNEKKYLSSKLTEPEKPIVFYLDSDFPENWKSAIKKGVLRWNVAFEKIGFKNAIEVRDFPETSASFDPDNLKYSTIRYIPFSSKEISSCFWADPNSGEIINGTLSLFANTEEILHRQRLVETAAVDPSVRSNKLPASVFEEALSEKVTHHIGKILGLEVNLAASSAFSAEQLRDKNFTEKNGISASVMDENPFNYVAQPSDKGVKLSQTELGPYDFYAIEYNYRFLSNDPKEDYKILGKMVDTKTSNPVYRYVPVQRNGIIDPSVLSGDLGNNAIKSVKYGIENLKYINKNFPNWIKNDEDSQIKKQIYLLITQKHYLLFKNVLTRVGGVYLNNAKESSSINRYETVRSADQKEALLWCINAIKNLHTFANTSFEKKGYAEVSYYDQLLEYLTSELFNIQRNIIVAHQIDKNSMSQNEFFSIVEKEIFDLADGRPLINNILFMQKFYVEKALGVLGFSKENEKNDAMRYGLQNSPSNFDNEGFGVPNQPLFPNVFTQGKDKSEMLFYESLVSLKPKIEKAFEKASTAEMKAHYNYLLVKINKIIEDASK